MLKSFEKHWAGKEPFEVNGFKPSGIACPKCGEEISADYSLALLSNPPKFHAKCECGWTGYV